MWRNRKLPVVTTVVLILNLLGLIYEYSVGQNRAVYTDPYGEEHIYRSRYIYSSLREDLIGKMVPVYIDRMNDSIGFVDVDSITPSPFSSQ